jgi:hypothetical protein
MAKGASLCHFLLHLLHRDFGIPMRSPVASKITESIKALSLSDLFRCASVSFRVECILTARLGGEGLEK